MIFDGWDDLRMHPPVTGTILEDDTGELYRVPGTWITGTTPVLTRMGKTGDVSPAADVFDHPVWPLTMTRVTKVGQLPKFDTTHPEDRCQVCGGPNPVWFTENALWNAVMGGPGGIVCPLCFVSKAESRGIKPTGWRISPEGGWTIRA